MPEYRFDLKPAVRENVPILIGLAGGTGSGKTFSALKLAKGLSGGKRFAVIDTENGRAKAYADMFQFDHGELHAPFRPEAYAKAITAVDALGQYPVIVVDSCSHEYGGDGGILDWQEEELKASVKRAQQNSNDSRTEYQIREANKMRSWIAPKMAHKAFMTKLLQVRAHLILCFRAEPKTEMAKDEKGKTIIREKQGLTGLHGWFPICEKNMPFELTAYFLLTADRPGYPQPIKILDQHKQFFLLDKPLTEEAGKRVGEWARGGQVSGGPAISVAGGADSSPFSPPENHSGDSGMVPDGEADTLARKTGSPLSPEYLNQDDVRDIETACSDARVRMSVVVDKLMRDFGSVEKTPREKKGKILEWIAAKRRTA